MYNFYSALGNTEGLKSNWEFMRKSNMHDWSIIIHLRFLKPDMDYTDVIYTTWDKFANFGGNFGIFAEITGVTFLGVLNLFFLCSARVFELCKSGIKKMSKDVQEKNMPANMVSPLPPISPVIVPKINNELKVEDFNPDVRCISLGSVYSMHSVIKIIDEDVENN